MQRKKFTSLKETAVDLFRGKEQRMIAFPNKVLEWEKCPPDLQLLQELVALLDATYLFFDVFDIAPLRWCCDTT